MQQSHRGLEQRRQHFVWLRSGCFDLFQAAGLRKHVNFPRKILGVWKPSWNKRRSAEFPRYGDRAMILIAYYLVFMVAGDFAAYFIGLFVEYEWGSQVSLIVFLALYFAFLWIAWLLAVWMTKPKSVAQTAS
jgi:hypothetical protein